MKYRVVCILMICTMLVALFTACEDTENNVTVTTTTVESVEQVTNPVSDETTTDGVVEETTTDNDPQPSTSHPSSRVTVSSGTTNNTTATTTTTTTTTKTTVTTTPCPKPTYTLKALDESAYYGYNQLKAMPNGKVLTEVYDDIVDAVEDLEDDVDLNVTLSVDELLKVFFYYRADYPQHFWCDGNINYYTQGNHVVRFELKYNMNESQVTTAKAAVKREVDTLLKIAATGKDEYERELLLHDALAKKITYRDGKHSHTLYGALVEGKAVCEGYARSFQYLLYQCGIQCLIAEGSGIDPSTGKPENHAWNAVRIAGQYYFVDLTWDDPDKAEVPVMYPYFNVSAAQLQADHTIDTAQCYPLPSCTATAANYHVKNGSRLTHFSVDAVAAAIKANPKETHLYVTDGPSTFIKWFGENHGAVIKAAGITGKYQYALMYMGNEVVIRIS